MALQRQGGVKGSDPVWLKISAASTRLKLLRLGVYWIARSRHGFHPEERL